MKADVIIVGGGIIGCATAYYLTKQGKSVIVLEASKNIGDGGSSRNGGGVRQSGRDPRELPLMIHGVKNLWKNLSKDLDVDCEYHQDGNLRLGKTEKHMEILQTLTDKAVACGVGVSIINGEEVRQINPYLSDEVIGASWCPTDGHANPLTTTLGFYKTARKQGAKFITEEKVIKLRKVSGALKQVVTENAVYEGDIIMVSAGYETKDIARTVGIELPLTKITMETLVTEAEKPMFDQMLGTAEADFYGHQTKEGAFVFGGSSGFEPFIKNDGVPISTSSGTSNTCRGVLKYFPMLKDTKIVRSWSGYIDECMDHVPILGKVDEISGLILACGFSGHGFGIAPPVAEQLAKLIVTDKTDFDLSEFRYNRFKTKQ